MTAYLWVYDSCHLQADCQELGSAPEPYARQSSMGYLYLFTSIKKCSNTHRIHPVKSIACVSTMAAVENSAERVRAV